MNRYQIISSVKNKLKLNLKQMERPLELKKGLLYGVLRNLQITGKLIEIEAVRFSNDGIEGASCLRASKERFFGYGPWIPNHMIKGLIWMDEFLEGVFEDEK